MKYDLVIFDLDGTVLNTLEDIKNSINFASRHFIKEADFNLEDVKSFIGSGVIELSKRALRRLDVDEDKHLEFLDLYNSYYSLHQKDNTKPYEDILEVLLTLKQNSLLAILSNKPDVDTKELINDFFPNIFDYIQGSKMGVPPKPDPTLFNELVNALKVDKKRILYLGDSNVDMKLGANVGVDTIGVTWGFQYYQDLIKENPLAIINSPKELLKYC